MNKNKLTEILDGDNNIIGSEDKPEMNLNNVYADGTTDHNSSINGQHFSNSYLGRFGFYFFENKETEGEADQSFSLLDEIAKLSYMKFQETIKSLGKDPKRYAEFRKMVEKPFEELSDGETQQDYELAKQVLDLLKTHSQEISEPAAERQLTESEVTKIIEDIIKKKADKMLSKNTDNDLLSDKAKKVKSLFADLSDNEKGELVKHLK